MTAELILGDQPLEIGLSQTLEYFSERTFRVAQEVRKRVVGRLFETLNEI